MVFSDDFRGEDLGSLYRKHTVVKIEKCPVCKSTHFDLWTDCGYTQAHKCTNCGLVFMSSQLSKSGLEDYYSNYIGKRRVNNLKKMELRKEQYVLDAELLRSFAKDGNLLDVGCNGGFFLEALGDRFNRHGTELDPIAVEYCEQTYPEFSKNVFQGSLDEARFQEAYFDVITMRGLFEHVSDPEKTLSHTSKLLKPGGILYFEIPNFLYL